MAQTFFEEDITIHKDAAFAPNVKQAVPFFMVTDIEASLRFYVDGLGFVVTKEWRPEKAHGRIQWCWLELGTAAVMLQEYWREGSSGGAPEGPLGQASQSASCARTQSPCTMLSPREESPPADRLLEMVCGSPRRRIRTVYRLDFESPTDAPKETVYSG